MLWVRQGWEPPTPLSRSPRPHLDLQLLHHLHLHAALGCAPVVQGVLCVEVSSGGGRGGEEKVGPGSPAVTTLPILPSNPAHSLESRQTKRYKEGKGMGKKTKTKTGQRRKPPSRQPPLMSLLKSQLQRSNCK